MNTSKRKVINAVPVMVHAYISEIINNEDGIFDSLSNHLLFCRSSAPFLFACSVSAICLYSLVNSIASFSKNPVKNLMVFFLNLLRSFSSENLRTVPSCENIKFISKPELSVIGLCQI